MCMDRHGSSASVVMTSTWHRVNGPMAGLMDRARAGEFPLFSFCAFEVLEHCSAERSGPWVGGEAGYANCPQCPLKPWCHAERDRNGDEPLAKRSDGHYAIDSLIQKVRSTSARTFESDYLCKGPRSDGLWFPAFDAATHVGDAGGVRPRPAGPPGDRLGGLHRRGLLPGRAGDRRRPGRSRRSASSPITWPRTARPSRTRGRSSKSPGRRCEGRLDVISTDPAGGARNPVGPTVIAEYERAGLRPLRRWPVGSVADGLALVESFVDPADGRSRLTIHPRCAATIRAMQNYRRAKRGGQWQDYPEDPQHPHEDLVDALRGGLRVCFPEGRSFPTESSTGPGPTGLLMRTPESSTEIISRRHPEWQEHHLRWRWMLDSLEGGERYRQAVYGYDHRGLPVRNLIRHKREYPDPRELSSAIGRRAVPGPTLGGLGGVGPGPGGLGLGRRLRAEAGPDAGPDVRRRVGRDPPLADLRPRGQAGRARRR